MYEVQRQYKIFGSIFELLKELLKLFVFIHIYYNFNINNCNYIIFSSSVKLYVQIIIKLKLYYNLPINYQN